MVVTNCATGTLAPYVPSAQAPWNRARIRHLYRRLGYGPTLAELEDGLSASPGQLIDQLIDQAIALPLTPEPEWSNWSIEAYTDFQTQIGDQVLGYMDLMVEGMITYGLRDKMTLFWLNHFVTKLEAYACPSWMYQYHRVLQSNALGNFRTMTEAVGTTPAMLVFLNGVQNNRFQPNENYARELFELFTLGRDNGYTQADIVNAARALTGWNGFSSLCAPITFVPLLHDPGPKTVFGQTGNFNYEQLHDVLFAQRGVQISEYVCGRLYQFFVHEEINEDIVAGMAQTFRDNNFELAPVLRQLFKSEHFFDAFVMGVQIKSPFDYFLAFFRENNLDYNAETLRLVVYVASQLGQQLFNPPDVAGWPENRSWVDTSTLTGRWQGSDYMLYTFYEQQPARLVALAKTLSNNSNAPEAVAAAIVDHFVAGGLLTPEAYDQATDVFKWMIPQNYYDDGSWNLDWETAPAQVALLLQHISRLPEFQLM
jgi:uncharacterized protein (DUF1800 family)